MVDFDPEIITADLPQKLFLYFGAVFIIFFLTPLAKFTLAMKIILAVLLLPITWIIYEITNNRY